MRMNIPLCIADVEDEEIAEVTKVLRSGWLAHGPKNKEFQDGFAKYIGVKHALALNSCTAALHLSIAAQDITGEVILPSFSFVASANAILTAGAKPVFVDIDHDTCNIDPKRIEEAITKDTQAIMPVHYAGQSCDMDAIERIAKKHDLKIIEDSAETLGGEWKGKKTGSFGIGCFSFYPTKNLTTGEGGMLTTDDDKVYEKAKAIHAHGIVSSAFEREKKDRPWLRSASYPGYNFRLCDILAALGVIQLKKLDNMNDLRRKHANALTKGLKEIEGIAPPIEAKNAKHVYQMYTIKLDESIDRTKFIAALREKGIGASVHFDPPIHAQQLYNTFAHNDLPITEKVARTIVTLPMFPSLTDEQINFMIESVRKEAKENRK